MKILIKDVLLDGNVTDIYINNGVIEEIKSNCTSKADKIINGKIKLRCLPLSTAIHMLP